MPIVTLKYRMPADIDDKKGTMFSDKYLDENLFFSGAYQVTKIESTMNQGEFKQTLTMVRINNQNGTTAPAELVQAENASRTKIAKTGNLNRKDYDKYFRS